MDLSKKLVSTNKLFAGATYYLPQNLSHRDSLTKYEKIPTYLHNDAGDAFLSVAKEIAELIQDKASKGEKCVLGLASGTTPIGLYKELVRLHQEEGLSFQNVVTFNLDEYYKMDPESNTSYSSFIHQNLLDLIDIKPENVFIICI